MSAGIDISAGKTITLRLDRNTDPSAIPVTDTLGMTTLELLHAWPSASAIEVRLDGALLSKGTGYTMEGSSLTVPSIGLGSQRTLTIKMPTSIPSNLLSNAGFESVNTNGTVPGWSQMTLSGGSARYESNPMQSHSGERSLRIKDPTPGAAPYICAWNSDAVTSGIQAGKNYIFHASYRTRMLKGTSVRAAIYWLDSNGNLLETSLSSVEDAVGYSTHGWTPLSFEAVAPAGTASAVVSLQTVGGAGSQAKGSVWFDDVSLSGVSP
jgi:hypothetical protein